MAAVDEKVKQIIVEQLGVDEAEVTPTASFVDDLGADSLDTVELVMEFEDEFELSIPDEEAEKIQKLIPKGRFVTVEKARHAVFRDNPEVFLQVLLEFLGRKGAKKIHPTQSQ